MSKSQIFLFHGEDDYTTTQKARLWVAAFANKHSAAGIISVDCGQDENWKKRLAESLEAQGLFSQIKLILVRQVFSQKAEDMEVLTERLDDVDAQTFILLWEERAVKKNLRLYKKIAGLAKSGSARISEHELPIGMALNRLIGKYAVLKNYRMNSAAVEKLAVLVGRDLVEKGFGASSTASNIYNLWQVTSEIDKLGTYAAGKEIVVEDVEQLVAGRVSENIFLFTNSLGTRSKKAARKYLDQLLSSNAPADAKAKVLPMVGALASQFRSLLLLGETRKTVRSAGEVAKMLGWTPYRVNANARILENFSESAIRKMLAELLEIDKKIKSTVLPPKVLLAQLVNRL